MIGFAVIVVTVVIIGYLSFYPQYRSKTSNVSIAPVTRGKSLLFDKRYGLCRIESAEPLSNNSFKLELFSSSGHTYYAKFYDDEITVYNLMHNLTGRGAPIYMNKRDYLDMDGKDMRPVDEVQLLRNELEQTKSRAKIQINDPDEKVNSIISWLSQLEASKKWQRETRA